ncbi:MAG: DUF1788 domain-containing protein [Bacteroidetes bacterium]|nr:DUF1788 domain-containing protein [Bacteroidota bacterium]
MLRNPTYDPPQHFEGLFKILSSQRFLKKEGLGGELPFFIHSFPVSQQQVVNANIQSLVKRLQNEGIEILEINLYQLCIDILKRANLFNQIIEQEKSTPKLRLNRIMVSSLNIEKVVIPEIHKRHAESNAMIVFLTGVGEVFPFIRSHSILNNTQTLVGNIPLVMFFPGSYNNKTLTLFELIKDENYYRAHNLNDYKI